MNSGPAHATAIAVIDFGDCQSTPALPPCGRFATRRLGGQALVQRIARRLSEATRVSRVLITGANLPTAILTSGLANVEVLDLPHTHACERLAAAADRSGADWVVYVPGNQPFVDPALIDCLINRAFQSTANRESDTPEPDYVGYCGENGNWQHVRHLGVAGEACHADALRRLRRNVDRLPAESSDQSLADWLQDAPGNYQLQWVPMPAALDQKDLRFAIEDESDWECAEMFSDYVGDESTEWQLLTGLVRDNVVLRDSMAERNRFAKSTNSP